MSKKNKDTTPQEFIFEKKNYIIMFTGLAFIALGFILMSGGGGDDPDVFNPEIFSFRRIRLAPTLVIIGFALEVYAILVPAKKKEGPGK